MQHGAIFNAHRPGRAAWGAIVMVALCLMAAPGARAITPENKDPHEKLNRKVMKLNDAIDRDAGAAAHEQAAAPGIGAAGDDQPVEPGAGQAIHRDDAGLQVGVVILKDATENAGPDEGVAQDGAGLETAIDGDAIEALDVFAVAARGDADDGEGVVARGGDGVGNRMERGGPAFAGGGAGGVGVDIDAVIGKGLGDEGRGVGFRRSGLDVAAGIGANAL